MALTETTSDGREYVIRPVEPGDKQLIADGLQRLSERSRYRRFLSPKPGFSRSELSYLTEIDHHDHEALIAVNPETGAAIGVARYVKWAGEERVAEPAVVVADDWQGQGVGKTMLRHLVDRAAVEGITAFRALVLRDNQPMLKLVEGTASPTLTDAGGGLVEMEFAIRREPHGAREKLLRALRAAARGDLTFRRPAGERPEERPARN